jgi:cysteine synthase A
MNNLAIALVTGLIGMGVGYFLSKFKKREKKTIIDLMKNTPMIYIKSLSELTGCEIYAKCEYYLPYTSKDRMIKNIILDAEK